MDPPLLYELVLRPVQAFVACNAFSLFFFLSISPTTTNTNSFTTFIRLNWSSFGFNVVVILLFFFLGDECVGTGYSFSSGRSSGLRHCLQERRASIRTESFAVYSSFWIGRCQSDQSPCRKFLTYNIDYNYEMNSYICLFVCLFVCFMSRLPIWLVAKWVIWTRSWLVHPCWPWINISTTSFKNITCSGSAW